MHLSTHSPEVLFDLISFFKLLNLVDFLCSIWLTKRFVLYTYYFNAYLKTTNIKAIVWISVNIILPTEHLRKATFFSKEFWNYKPLIKAAQGRDESTAGHLSEQ